MRILTNKITSISYTICEHIQLQRIGNVAIYIDLRQGNYIKLPWDVHQWIISDKKEEVENLDLLEQLNSIIQKLVDGNYIMPDLSKIHVGKAFIYISKGTLPVQEKVGLMDLYVENSTTLDELKAQGFIDTNSTINLIYKPHVNLTGVAISGRIITDSFSSLHFIKDVNCKGIRIESNVVPDNDDIKLLLDTLKKYQIQIALHYSLDRDTSTKLFDKFSKIQNKNLSVIYDTCIMHLNSNEIKQENDLFFNMPDIPHQALKKIKISCGAGLNRFFIDTEGNIFPCYRMRFTNPIENIFSIRPDYFIESRKLARLDMPKMCQICNVKYFCGCGCKAEYKNNCYILCKNISKSLKLNLQS